MRPNGHSFAPPPAWSHSSALLTASGASPLLADGAPQKRRHTIRLHAAITHRGIALDYQDTLGGALGLSCGGAIRVVRGLAPAAEFVVLAHEFAHELLHHGDGPRATRERRELEAETVAFVVSTASGLETLAATVDFVHLYRGDRQALAASLDRIQRAAAPILRAMDSD